MSPYIFRINLYDLASTGILFSGLTLSLLVGFAKRVGQAANLFLSLALVVIVLKTSGLTAIFLPALGPLLRFYVRQLTCRDQRFSRKDMLHFCPLLAGFFMPAWVVLISVIIYLYLSHRLIEDFYRRLQLVLMDRPRSAFRSLDRMLRLLGLFCVLSLFNGTFCLAIALVLIGMAAEVMLKPDGEVYPARAIADRSDIKEKGRRLKEVVAANRLYEDAELTLTLLAAKLSIPRMIYPGSLTPDWKRISMILLTNSGCVKLSGKCVTPPATGSPCWLSPLSQGLIPKRLSTGFLRR